MVVGICIFKNSYVTEKRLDKNIDKGNNKSIKIPTHQWETLAAIAAFIITNDKTPAFTAFFMLAGEFIWYAFINGVKIAIPNKSKNGITVIRA
jgi:hypothetical protein